jgi:hypothetical protein
MPPPCTAQNAFLGYERNHKQRTPAGRFGFLRLKERRRTSSLFFSFFFFFLFFFPSRFIWRASSEQDLQLG